VWVNAEHCSHRSQTRFPRRGTGGAIWNGSWHLSTSNAFTDNSEPKQTRQSGECSCGYCRRRKPAWRRSVKTPPVEPTFDRPFLARPCMFIFERFLSMACAIRPPPVPPAPVRARLALSPEPAAHPFLYSQRQCTGLERRLSKNRKYSWIEP